MGVAEVAGPSANRVPVVDPRSRAPVTLRWFPLSLTLGGGVETARGTLRTRRVWRVRAEDVAGSVGWGEAAPLTGFGLNEVPGWERGLERAAARWTSVATLDPDALGSAGAAGTDPFLHAAVATALADLQASWAGVPLARWLCATAVDRVPLNRLWLDDASTHALASGCGGAQGVFKLKVGMGTPDQELRRVHGLMERHPAVRWRLDANQAWSFAEARSWLAGLRGWPVAYVEEPLASPTASQLAELRELGVPLAADESALLPSARRALLDESAVDVLVIKPNAIGGPVAAWHAAAEAGRRGVRVTLTSMLEGAVGVQMAAHVAAAVEGAGWGTGAHGVATLAEVGGDPWSEALLATASDGAWTWQVGDLPGLGFGHLPAPRGALEAEG